MTSPIQFGIRLTADGAQAAGEMQRFGRTVAGTRDEIDRATSSATAHAGAVRSMSGALGGYASAAAAALSVGRLITAADDWGQLASRIDMAAGSADAAAEATARLMDVSNRTYKAFGNSSELYIRSSSSLKELGYSADETLGMVEALQYGLTVSSANQERSASVIDAWSKSVLNGKMGIEEYQTVIAGAPRLQQALADSLGVTNAELQQMARDGKLTSDVLVGVGSQVQRLAAEADRMPVTMADSWVRFNNQLSRFSGEAESNVGAIRMMTSGVTLLGDNLDTVAQIAGVAGVAALGRYGGALASTGIARARDAIATQRQAREEIAHQQALAATAAAQARAALSTAAITAAREREAAANAAAAAAQARLLTGSTLARGAITALGGPIGAVTTLLGVGALAWMAWGDSAESAGAKAQRSIDAALDRARQLKSEQKYGSGDVGTLSASLDTIDSRLTLLNQSQSPAAKDEAARLVEQRRIIEDALNQIETGGIAKREQNNARYATYINERRSLAERLKSELDTEAQAFAAATQGLNKESAEYTTALDAHERRSKEIREEYAKKAAFGQPKTPKNNEVARAYVQAMEQLGRAEREAALQGELLTASQRKLQEIMASAEWDQFDSLEQWLVQDAAQAAGQAEAAAAYRNALNEIDSALRSAQKSTMDLDAAQSALYDLMLSPAWQQMSDQERNAAAVRTETASATLRQIELERALQAARGQTVSALQATQQEQMAYVGQQYQSGRFGAVGSDGAAKQYNEIIAAMSSSGVSKQLQSSIGGSVARGLASGLMSGASATESLGNALQQTLMQAASNGLTSAFEDVFSMASDWLTEMFSSAAGSSGSSGSWVDAVVSLFSAKGNAFTGAGPVQAFAAGGAFGNGEVLTQPTWFRFAAGGEFRNGVAGEAGPEAALPLKRMSNGKLGVYADFVGAGGASMAGGTAALAAIYVAITVNADGSSRAETSSGQDGTADYVALARQMETVTRNVLSEEMRPGGLLYQPA